MFIELRARASNKVEWDEVKSDAAALDEEGGLELKLSNIKVEKQHDPFANDHPSMPLFLHHKAKHVA